jgi:hypothetical protein
MPTTEEILDKLERERQAREQQIAKRQPILAPIEQKPVLMGQPMVQPTGPDIQAMPAPMMPIPTLQPPPIDNGPSPLGQALGGLAGAGASFGLKKLFASKPAADPAYQINKPKLEIPSNIGGMVPPSHVNPLPMLGGAPGEFSALKAAPKVAPVGGGGIGGTISKVGKIFGFEGGGTWAELKKALQQGPVEVGEAGPELLTKGGVIPAPETRQLLRKVAPDPNYTPGAFPSMQSNGSNEFAGETAPRLKMVGPRFSQQQDQTGQQGGQDAGVVPVADRRAAIETAIKNPVPIQPNNLTYNGRGTFDQSQVQPVSGVQPVRAVQPVQQTPAPAAPSAAPTVKPRHAPEFVSTGDHEKDVNDYIDKLEAYKPENHNSRWKGIAASAGRMFLQALQGGNLIQAVGSAIFGAAYGAFDKSFDEKLAKQWNLSTAEREQAQMYARRMKRAQLQSSEAEASMRTQQAADYPDKVRRDAQAKTDAATARTRAELDRIIRTYYPKGAPPDGFPAEIVNRAKELNYPLSTIPDKPPYSAPPLGSPQNRGVVATAGQSVYVPDGKGGLVSVPMHDPQGNPAPTMTDFQKGDLGLQQQRNNQFAGRRYQGGRGGSSGRGGGNQRDIGFAESGAAGAQANAQEARERAVRLRGQGLDAEAAAAERTAQAWEEKGRVESGRLQRAGGSPRAPAGNLGAQSVGGGLGAAARPKQYTVAEIRAMAQSDGKDPDAAVRYARQNGRLKRGN